MGITRVITWACRLNFPSMVINSSENKDRMLMERIRITAFFYIWLSYRWAFREKNRFFVPCLSLLLGMGGVVFLEPWCVRTRMPVG